MPDQWIQMIWEWSLGVCIVKVPRVHPRVGDTWVQFAHILVVTSAKLLSERTPLGSCSQIHN